MNGKVLGIISGKGGVGKTTCAINICAALSEVRRDVVVVDADLKMSGLGLQLGMYSFRKTINDLLDGTGEMHEAVHIHESGLKVIPSSLSPTDSSLFNLRSVFRHPFLQENFVIVDSPPGLERSTLDIINVCSETVAVTTPEIPSVINTVKVLTKSMELGVRPAGIIVNMYDKNGRDQITPGEIETTCGVPVIGVIPTDRMMRRSINRRTPLVTMSPYSPASVEFRRVAAELDGRKYVPERNLALKRVFRGLFGNGS